MGELGTQGAGRRVLLVRGERHTQALLAGLKEVLWHADEDEQVSVL